MKAVPDYMIPKTKVSIEFNACDGCGRPLLYVYGRGMDGKYYYCECGHQWFVPYTKTADKPADIASSPEVK